MTTDAIQFEAQLNPGAAIGVKGADGDWWVKIVAGAESASDRERLATLIGATFIVTILPVAPPTYGTRQDDDDDGSRWNDDADGQALASVYGANDE